MNFTLLIVDDEYWARYKLVHQYRWDKVHVDRILEAEDGEKAISVIEANHVDLVITDMDMPYMTGGALAESISEQYPKISVIALSGYSDFPTVHSAIVGGVVDYLLKPVSEEDLFSVIQKCETAILSRRSAAGSADGSADAVKISAEGTGSFAKDTADGSPDHTKKNPGNGSGKDSYRHDLVDQVREYIDRHVGEPLSLTGIADALHMSPSYLSRRYKEKSGSNISEYITRSRMNHSVTLLKHSELSLMEVAEKVGYTDYSYFCSQFHKYYSMSPKEYRKNH